MESVNTKFLLKMHNLFIRLTRMPAFINFLKTDYLIANIIILKDNFNLIFFFFWKRCLTQIDILDNFKNMLLEDICFWRL